MGCSGYTKHFYLGFFTPQGWKLQNNSACPSDMRLTDLLVRHYFLPVLNSKYTINVKISAFPSDIGGGPPGYMVAL